MEQVSRRARPRRSAAETYQREFAVLSGFCARSLVMTEDGPQPLEWIAVGDKVLTRDAGFQPVLWVEHNKLSMSTLQHLPELAPVRVERGAFDDDLPNRDMMLSPSQLIYVERTFDKDSDDGVLIAADVLAPRLVPIERPKAERVNYVSLLLDGHHLIQVEGVWAGSLFIADAANNLPDSDPICTQLRDRVMEPVAPILPREDSQVFLANKNASLLHKRA